MRLVLLALTLTACPAARTTPDATCEAFVARLDQCDPSAAGMPQPVRAALRSTCPGQARQCAAIDTSTDGGCNAFMGCLYDGP